ncbi:hypothetical protein A3A46_02770 [Candidatus Roizmanbacteria bacterium RIFCSPLOWO2_01_FULL_37_13]|uniref:Antitoxin n=1 Tax=Candidatus Roizmanbacteria bacterium RIFCSPHIGHO2_02_FULL_38_11 TaxID=1802039 RepID=A0A1F7H3K2_9BACT|nr:MAG: hypothetical protein A3C25_00150 [Candidatus Roizmanbacteria bacterium RIFCSPHIGHO2_02_FULL_38_11]OGK34999.1 MAG: hypothetical protein A3F58_03000 [Candidatus Roizmanbacteria bacterium RIFCSPHIGHO2_12_FULL_37_9b]OGK43048.1 MAG: hypothetical protein A3A46_02770 [Candidatus Roizmanbacteria bacterium RIFCSPLOWO2_01_FULL_37_13]
MNIQQLDQKIVSITQVRRDIDVLNRILEKEQEAVVMKNQKILFIAVKPDKYNQMKSTTRKERIESALKFMDASRKKYKFSGNYVSDYIVKMRDERVKKWKK